MKIQEANYMKDNYIERVIAINLSKNQYIQKYRGFLYCIEPNCNALLSFVERKKNGLKYFRTWSKSQHMKDCPYEVVYDEINKSHHYTDNTINLNLTDKHIIEKLKRVFDSMIENIPLKTNISIKKDKTKNNQLLSDIISPALFGDGEDLLSEKQPYILTRKFDNLDKDDIGKVRCVIGTVHSIYLFKKHGYINLTQKSPESVKVCFNRAFVESEKNSTQYQNFDILKNYCTDQKSRGNSIICCCIGLLDYAKTGINIYPDRYNGFTLNGLSYYDIIREFNMLK